MTQPVPQFDRLLRPPIWTAQLRWLLLALSAIGWSLLQAGLFRQELLNLGGVGQLAEFLSASWQPDLSPDFLRLTVRSAVVTLAYAVCGTALSVSVGLGVGVLVSEVWWQSLLRSAAARPFRVVWLGIRGLLAFPRAIHELIWGLFFVNIFGLDPLVAVLGIAVPYSAIVAKVFSELLDEVPRQPLQSLLNGGVQPLTAFFYTILPQAFLDLLSYTFYRFECSIRSATVLGIIGAGGLGYEILLSLQSLRYSQLWTLFYALLILNGAVDLASAWLRKQLGAPSRLDLNLKRRSASLTHRSVSPAPPSDRSPRRWTGPIDPLMASVAIGMVAIMGFSFGQVGADWSKLWSPRTGRLLGEVAQSIWPLPLTRDTVGQLASLSLQTIAMSVLAIAIATVGGLLLALPAAQNLFLPQGQPRGLVAWLLLLGARLLLLLCRSIPAPIWALVFLFVLFPGVLPGAIALGIHNLGILGRLMTEVIENLDRRPLLALKAQGSPAILVLLYGLLPLTLTRFLAYALYRWEVCMRETVIVGLVGAGGLGRVLTEHLSSFDYGSVVVTLGAFMGLTFAVDWVSGLARRSLR